MSLKKKWKTTCRPEGPAGNRRVGTFKDISLTGYAPKFIDDLDHFCQQRDFSRSSALRLLEILDIDQQPQRLFDFEDEVAEFRAGEYSQLRRLFSEQFSRLLGRKTQAAFNLATLEFFETLDQVCGLFDVSREDGLKMLSEDYPENYSARKRGLRIDNDRPSGRSMPFRDLLSS
jgi:hypothetical protein